MPTKPRRLTTTPTTKTRAARPWYSTDWDKLSRDARQAWVAEHGPLCPGYQRGPHIVRPDQLTLDHVTGRRTDGGLMILCRSCNGRKG